MSKNRLEAFSDGVLAIIITIMVLKLEVPDYTSLHDLIGLIPTLLSYAMSYAYVGIYWVNHHHIMTKTQKVDGKLLWRNLLWLFFMSFIPFTTEWLDKHPMQNISSFFYGLVLLLCAISYNRLQASILKISGKNSELAKEIGYDLKGKMSIVLYALGVGLSFVWPVVSYIIYALVAVGWIVPGITFKKLKSGSVK